MANKARVFTAAVPIAVEAPSPMSTAIETVLAGEYESGFFGENLTIVDIGANVGSFSIWANLRWPNSAIHAYEPNPKTFDILRRNVAHLGNIEIHNAALWPTDEPTAPFFSRYAGDGEAGLTAYMGHTFDTMVLEAVFPVPVIHPNAIPHADIIKLDVEGAEWEILQHLDISNASLLLFEYQNDDNREAIKQFLAADFSLEFEDRLPWKALLEGTPLYRRDLDGNHYGRLFFARRRSERLQRMISSNGGTHPSSLEARSETPRRRIGHHATLNRQVKRFDEYCADGEYYEHIIHNIIQCFVRPGQVVVDGGAHRGLHTFPLCDRVGATGRVYAIEPIKELATALKESGRPQMRVVEAAITDHNGEAVFFHHRKDEGMSALGPSIQLNDPDLKQVRVAARMLDDIVPEHETVRFIKLDLEGGEFDALRGARRILERNRPLVVFEHGANASASRYNYKISDFIRFWEELGYSVVDLFGRPKHGKRFEEPSVWYLVAGADNDSLQLINNLEIPVTLAAQQMARKNRSFGLRSVPQGSE